MLPRVVQHNNPCNLGELGWIGAAIAAVGALIPVIVRLFKGEGKDVWSAFSTEEKHQYVRESIIVVVEAVRQGQVPTVDAGMREMIALVEKDEGWDEWKSKNLDHVEWIKQAQAEIDAEKSNSVASIFSSNILLWALGLSVVGWGAYKYMHRNDNVQTQKLITTK